jgi:N-acetylglucosaminyl-diphospho-decaprenol L-rhamnosyltransferase
MYNITITTELFDMTVTDLSIIIVNWRSKDYVRQCLNSIHANTDKLSLEIFVVDNASFDGCEEMIANEFPNVLFIQLEKNIGFAGANNLAFSGSKGRNTLFLNPDTKIQERALERLVAELESHADAGLIGAHLLNADLTVQTTCITALPGILNQSLNLECLRRTFPRLKIWGMWPLFDAAKVTVSVEAISGACMLGRREVIESVGAFSMDYLMYAEDMDLCVKIHQAGWQIYYVPDAKIVHYGGRSSSFRKESNFSNIVLRKSIYRFFQIHRGSLYANCYRLSAVLISILRILVLATVFPLLALSAQRQALTRALSKWCSILGWSIGLA